jgi:hypothetical protein
MHFQQQRGMPVRHKDVQQVRHWLERMPMKKGFIFTTDAFVALTLISMVVIVIIYQLNIPSALFPQQMQTHDFATDIMVSFTTLKMSEVETAVQPVKVFSYEEGNTVLEQIAKKALSGKTEDMTDARTIAQQLLIGSGANPMLPSQFGMSIFVREPDGAAWTEVKVREAPYTRVQSSASYVLLGYSQSAPRDPGAPPYDYPPGEEDGTKYCSNGEPNPAPPVVLPCPPKPNTVYQAGDLMHPTFVRVIVWV